MSEKYINLSDIDSISFKPSSEVPASGEELTNERCEQCGDEILFLTGDAAEVYSTTGRYEGSRLIHWSCKAQDEEIA